MSCPCSDEDREETDITALSIPKCYSDWLCPKRAYAIRALEEFRTLHPLFRTLLDRCEKKDVLRYETNLFPVFLIAGHYAEAYPQLRNVKVEYRNGNCVENQETKFKR